MLIKPVLIHNLSVINHLGNRYIAIGTWQVHAATTTPECSTKQALDPNATTKRCYMVKVMHIREHYSGTKRRATAGQTDWPIVLRHKWQSSRFNCF